MQKITYITGFCIFIFLCSVSSLSAQDTLQFPTPSGNQNQLFYLQRPPNINTVIYELNIQNGVIDSAEPVHVYWIRYAEKSQKAELSGIQRKYAYGLATKWVGKDHYELRFLANKKYVIELMKGSDNRFHIYDMINQKQAILTKVFLQINGGPVFSPNIEYVILSGIDPETGVIVTEKKKMQ